MGGSKSTPEVRYEPAPATAAAVSSRYRGEKAFDDEEQAADIETASDLYIKKKRKGKRALKTGGVSPMGGASLPTDGASGLSVPY